MYDKVSKIIGKYEDLKKKYIKQEKLSNLKDDLMENMIGMFETK